MGANRSAKLTLLSSFLSFVAALVFYNCCLDNLITAMYRGESLPFLNHLIHNADGASLSYYLIRARLVFTYLTLLAVAALICVAAALSRDYTRQIIVDFFTTPTSPLNLAIFRVAVFLGVLSQIHPSETIWFGKVPHVLQMAPVGVGWLLPHLPISESSMTLAVALLILACVTGILGLFTRTSAFLAMIGAFYVLGVPEFYGTVEHYHHLIWFLAILAVSPSGDALSVDSFLKATKRRNRGLGSLPQPSVAYSLPLRFACLLIGVIYFFPGFWKIRVSGFDWAFTDNLRYVMYARWADLDALTPFFRLDLHPWLYQSIALGTLVFELSFIFVVFFPRLRPVAAIVGLGFHFGSGMFMRIPFFDLWICYVVLFDVSEWLAALGRRFFPGGLIARILTHNPVPGEDSRNVAISNVGARQCAPVAIVGTLLLVACCYWGSRGIVRGWPFACYPRFAWNPGSEVESIEISALTSGGDVVFQDTPDLHRTVSYHAFGGQLGSLLSMRKQDPSGFARRLRALWSLHVQQYPPLANASIIRCYRVTLNTVPERRNENPVQRELIFEFRP
jgi:Vitamin K-dependent gamma-carboxylase